MLSFWITAALVAAEVQSLGNLTVIGDSIASGYGLEGYVSGDDYSAAGSFGNILGEECSDYRNFAVDGRKSSELLAALSQSGSELESAIADSDSVVVSIGGNDFLKPILSAVKSEALTDTSIIQAILDGQFKSGMIGDYANKVLTAALSAAESVNTEETVENIRKITERIHEINPSAKIVLLTVYNPFHGNVLMESAASVADEKLSELNSGIVSLEGDLIKIADIYTAFRGREAQLTNINKLDIHPSAEGHKVISEEVRKILAEKNL